MAVSAIPRYGQRLRPSKHLLFRSLRLRRLANVDISAMSHLLA